MSVEKTHYELDIYMFLVLYFFPFYEVMSPPVTSAFSAQKDKRVAWRDIVFWATWPKEGHVVSLSVSIKWHNINWQLILVLLNSMMLRPLSRQHQLVPQVYIFVHGFDLALWDHRLSSHLTFFCHNLATVILPLELNYKYVWYVSNMSRWDKDHCKQLKVFVCEWQAAAGNIINMLWQLMENGLEELKLLQTVLVLLTTNTVVHDEVLSKVGDQHTSVSHKCLYTFPTPLYLFSKPCR